MPSTLRPWSALVVPPQLDGRVLTHMLSLLMALDIDYLREYPNTPSIYAAGVRYIPEKPGEESWLSIPFVRMFGGSVCHSLACWRAAELRAQGEDAWPKWTSVDQADGSKLFHVRVFRGKESKNRAHPEGRIEDPSLYLGMLSSANVKKWGPSHHVDSAPGMIWY